MSNRMFGMIFAKIYPMYVQKVERKGRSKAELDTVLKWLTGYDDTGLTSQIESETTLEEFFAQAPQISPNANLIKGVICGVRVEDIADPLVQKIRRMDKVVDELAKGKAINKIMREGA